MAMLNNQRVYNLMVDEHGWNMLKLSFATKIFPSARQMIRDAEFTKGRIGPPLNRQMGLVPAMALKWGRWLLTRPGYVKIAIENDHRNSGFSHEKWWFSIVMLVYQMVTLS